MSDRMQNSSFRNRDNRAAKPQPRRRIRQEPPKAKPCHIVSNPELPGGGKPHILMEGHIVEASIGSLFRSRNKAKSHLAEMIRVLPVRAEPNEEPRFVIRNK